jgi:hypothetical protein
LEKFEKFVTVGSVREIDAPLIFAFREWRLGEALPFAKVDLPPHVISRQGAHNS